MPRTQPVGLLHMAQASIMDPVPCSGSYRLRRSRTSTVGLKNACRTLCFMVKRAYMHIHMGSTGFALHKGWSKI